MTGVQTCALPILQWLDIGNFPNLITFPESIRNPISLETLTFWKCPNLTTLPDDGFIKSLRKLLIINCPQLAEKYKNKIDKDFPNLEIGWRWDHNSKWLYFIFCNGHSRLSLGTHSMISKETELLQLYSLCYVDFHIIYIQPRYNWIGILFRFSGNQKSKTFIYLFLYLV